MPRRGAASCDRGACLKIFVALVAVLVVSHRGLSLGLLHAYLAVVGHLLLRVCCFRAQRLIEGGLAPKTDLTAHAEKPLCTQLSRRGLCAERVLVVHGQVVLALTLPQSRPLHCSSAST